MSPDVKGVLTPAATTAWKILLLVASISVGSIEAYKLVVPREPTPVQQANPSAAVLQDMSNTLVARRVEIDRLSIAMAEMQDRNKTSDAERAKMVDQITQIRIRLAACRCAYSQNANENMERARSGE